MEKRRLRIESRAFRSIVARRVFILFVLCSLIPLAALAYFSLGRVTGQLELQALQRLSHTTKSTGMSIFEHLLFLEADLKILGRELARYSEGGPALGSVVLDKRLERRFRNLFVTDAQGNLLWSAKAVETLLPRTGAERDHLKTGNALILASASREGQSDLFMAVRMEEPGNAERILYAEIEPRSLLSESAELFGQGGFFVITPNNHVVVSQFSERLPLRELRDVLLARGETSGSFEFGRQDTKYLATYWTLFLRPKFFTERWTVAVFEDKGEILAPLRDFSRLFLLIVLLSLWCILLFSFVQIRRILVPIEKLTAATRRLGKQDFESKVRIESKDEFQELGDSFNEMINKLKEHITAMETINQIGISLSSESKDSKLLGIILSGAKRIINADGGAIYKVADGNRCVLSMLQIDSIPLEMGLGKSPPAALEGLNEEARRRTTEAHAAATQGAVNVPDLHSCVSHDFSGNHAFDRAIGYRSRSVLAVPLKNHENQVTGIIQLLNARDKRTGEIIGFTMENQRLLESLASQAGVALSKNEMVQVYKRLFESLVELIAKAIDEKSPYTGDHCRRVPILVEMLTEAACRTREGNLKSFNLTEDELYELKVATLLHDCGKVTTPVHIIDKATKLEKIFDRIHLIDTRFEVLKRDAEISFIRRKVSSLETGEAFDDRVEEEKLRNYIDEIERDRQTLRAANVGAEHMDEGLRDQVMAIKGKYRWANPAGREEPLLSGEEIYQLLIPNGTLSPEDRDIINYHMVATLKMLESLSYPKNLRNIPKYAGTHHERQDGSGYPKGLKGDEIPMQGRIIAIADVFEALTAKDRPYKKPLTLSESLGILRRMRDEGKLDRDLVDVFIGEKVFLRYAERYLDPEQVDEEFLSEFEGYHPSN